MPSEVSPLAELLGHAWYHFDHIKPLLPTYGHLLVSALFPIWIGAHASLSRPSSAAKPAKKCDDEREDYETDEEGEDDQGPVQKMEGLEPSDALMFPLTAGLTLGALYLVIKWLEDPAILNKILSFYFSQMGVFFAVAFLKDALLIVRSLIFPRYYRYDGKVWRVKQSERVFTALGHIRHSPLPGIFGAIPLPKAFSSAIWAFRNVLYRRLALRAHIRGLFDTKTLVGLLDILSAIFSLGAVGYFAFVTKPWWLTNFLGFSFCYGALQFMSPSTFWTGSLILGSLFFYDIYFVFFTPLMVTVATKLDVPIKLLFPRPPSPGDAPDVEALAMLGLGDIVIPGMMIGLALRFDLFRYYERKGHQKAASEAPDEKIVKPAYQRATGAWGERFWAPPIVPREPEFKPPYSDARDFSKTYFKASLVGYVSGMVATLLAMQYSNHAQPALLYLVPGVLLSLWGTAFFRGEIHSMWNFSDAEEETDEEKEEKVNDSAKGADDEKDKLSSQTLKSLFMRIRAGEQKPSTDGSDGRKGGKDAEEKVNSHEAAKDNRSKDKDSQDDLTLISFSVSYPRKSPTNIRSSPSGSLPEDENGLIMFPEAVDGDHEPPLKKRRGTPRKASVH
ncbi:Peptidase A22B signal peptide peptidase [Penicillium hispanicum]|uniref:Peptidase A22B signal peptide peptidase n=1 Tax=Penicillium hispanicum TaxID=1080232 RepID=UPI002541F552|nr:Peptidase A22B signal peptide peptidase [Penicillium hispanicum]KAJ5595564.1 Peptidase A22B signal peptide peptidase [Penicillium hispanicum]